VTQWEPTCASAAASSRDAKIRLINDDPYRTISDIKLKRTDTTLDLSQKAVEEYLLAGVQKLCCWWGVVETYQRELKRKEERGGERGVYIVSDCGSAEWF
jgi:hypothetical protein